MGSGESNAKVRIILGWMPLQAIIDFVMAACPQEEIDRLPEIVSKWESANKKFAALNKDEPGKAEEISVRDMNSKSGKKLRGLEENFLFKKTFGKLKHEFKMVELDKLVTFQVHVYLDTIKKFKDEFSENSDEGSLIDGCLSLKKEYPKIAETKADEKTYIFSSESMDLRYLGATVKPLNQEELEHSFGGIPIKAFLVLLGYSTPRMNVLSVGKRHFLNNGLHRAFALHEKGIKYAPVVLQKLEKPLLEFPPVYMNVTREFALQITRPPLLGDFFDPELTIDLKVKPIRKAIKVSVTTENLTIPL